MIDLGRMSYAAAYAEQIAEHERVLAERGDESKGITSQGRWNAGGTVFFVEHDPVITVTKRAGAAGHLLATPEMLACMGVEVAETDRGGDITYHGPGQLVTYVVVDLNAYGLGLHDYMRLLEAAVIDMLGVFGVEGERDCDGKNATGVWVRRDDGVQAKICAMGVRVRKWVTMHGLAVNIDPRMDHFGLIVPCGLAGRPVTSMKALLAERCPSINDVKREVIRSLEKRFSQRIRS